MTQKTDTRGVAVATITEFYQQRARRAVAAQNAALEAMRGAIEERDRYRRALIVARRDAKRLADQLAQRCSSDRRTSDEPHPR